jgi:hypothetical protein
MKTLLNILAFFFLFIALVIPNRLVWITPGSFVFLPLELIVFSLLLLVPARAGQLLRVTLALVWCSSWPTWLPTRCSRGPSIRCSIYTCWRMVCGC